MFDHETDGSRGGRWNRALDSGLVAALLTLLVYGGLYVLSVEPTRVISVSPGGSTGLTSVFEPRARYNCYRIVPDQAMQTVFWPAHAVDRQIFPDRWESISMPIPIRTRRTASLAPVRVLPEGNALPR